MLRRVSPAPDNLSVHIPIQAIDTSLPNTSSNHASNENLQHRHSSELQSRRNTRSSMDLFSKGTLSFHNISYMIGGRQKTGRCKHWYPSFTKPKPEKQIIDDVSGIFTTGMNAIMGKNSLFPYVKEDNK